MKKTLGQIVYENPRVYAGAKIWGPWSAAPDCVRAAYNNDAILAKLAVLRELRRDGRIVKLTPIRFQKMLNEAKARKK